MAKVRFFSDYDTSSNLLNRFKENYIIYDNEIEFTLLDDYDFAVVFNRAIEPLQKKCKVITIIQEPSWSPSHRIQTFLLHSDYLIIHDPSLFENVHRIKLGGKVIESPSFMFYHDKVDRKIFEGLNRVDKQKKISIIVSGLNYQIGNYSKRIDLLRRILNSDLDIDIYGKWLKIADPRFKGYLEFKYTGLIPYEYSIAIENSNENNYITEKFFDCAICNTIPIYHGAPNIKEVYDESYFEVLDLDSPDIIKNIKEIIYKKPSCSDTNRNIYFQNYNLYSKLKEIIKYDF